RPWLRPPPWNERPGSPSSSSSREEPLLGPHCTSVPQVVAVARLLPLQARVVPVAPRSARSSGSCLLAGVDGASNRGQQQGGASSRSSLYQRPTRSRGSTTSSSSGSGSSGSSKIRSKFRQLSTRGGGRSQQ
ncbi:hypothetical protein Taro_046452, partial [Colocasia esculenta]|nr:hypothetical protein [Colocasia esculenta]